MEDNFYNDGFEDFLQRQVKDTRMYPSDGIWRNINKQIHGDTNWPGLTFVAFAFLAAIIFISVYFSPSPDIFESLPVSRSYIATHIKKATVHKNGELVAASPVRNHKKLQPIPFVSNEDEEDIAGVATEVVRNIVFAKTQEILDIQAPAVVEVKANKSTSNFSATSYHASTAKPSVSESPLQTDRSPSFMATPGTIMDPLPGQPEKGLTEPEPAKSTKEEINKNFEEDYLKRPIAEYNASLPGLNHSKNRFSYTVFIAASSSYRRLFQNEVIQGDGKTGPIALNRVIDVNKVVRHKPGTGIEAGVSFMYSIIDKLKITTGLQFNIRQYTMAAYMATTEVATIGLINRSGGVDSMGTYAVYRNSNGYLPTELVNRNYQVSLPVGLQWEVWGNRNVQLNVAASVQPTYSLNRNAYLISTDYKNYTQNPEIMRNWNVNTSLETFISVKSGDFKWQLGPQFRYQKSSHFH